MPSSRSIKSCREASWQHRVGAPRCVLCVDESWDLRQTYPTPPGPSGWAWGLRGTEALPALRSVPTKVGLCFHKPVPARSPWSSGHTPPVPSVCSPCSRKGSCRIPAQHSRVHPSSSSKKGPCHTLRPHPGQGICPVPPGDQCPLHGSVCRCAGFLAAPPTADSADSGYPASPHRRQHLLFSFAFSSISGRKEACKWRNRSSVRSDSRTVREGGAPSADDQAECGQGCTCCERGQAVCVGSEGEWGCSGLDVTDLSLL